MRFQPVRPRVLVLPLIALLMAGCLTERQQAGFVEPSGNRAPTINGTPPITVAVGQGYSFTPDATDPDGDSVTFEILNRPAWSSFDTATGRLSGTPASAGNFADIRISATDGQFDSSLADFSITVTDVTNPPTNSAPSISGNPSATAKVGEAYSFTPIAADADGDTLTFGISNKPVWAAFDSATGELSGTPTTGTAGNYANILISVSDGQESDSLAVFSINVTDDSGTPTNNAPVISGNPATSVLVGQNYSFTPAATDADGDTLTFSISNKPAWAIFDSVTGQLSGTPTNAGNFPGIQITVTDGQDSASLAEFAISAQSGNSSPVIGGNPSTSVKVGEAYSFTPTSSDADGDTLIFSIANKPGWANFNSGTGRLFGTPGDGDVGSFTGIVISVSDGSSSTSLPGFQIDVTQVALKSTTLNWTAPTQNEDGSALSDLTQFKIYYGTSSRNYTSEIVINNPGVTTYLVDNLTPDTYYFVATAINSSGEESRFSGELVRDLN